MADCPSTPDGYLSVAEFWAQLRDRIQNFPTLPQQFLQEGSPHALETQLTALEVDDLELEKIAASKGLRVLAPVRQVALQAENAKYSAAMLYALFDRKGDLVAEMDNAARASVWLHREAEAIGLTKHLIDCDPLGRARDCRL